MKLTHALGATVVVAVAAMAQTMGSTDKISRFREAVSHVPAQDGNLITYQDYAAYAWRTDTPDRPDSPSARQWPIVAMYTQPMIVWYYDGSFRASNGGKWGQPSRWAYLRVEPEVWNPAKQQWEIDGLGYTAPPPTAPPTGKTGVHMDATQGQWMVDDLKRSFTTTQIQDMMDASPYDEPDTTAPEPGAGDE